ncbi:hypothetical protein SHIRM173S_00981 [Streptomyces hirsutus]
MVRRENQSLPVTAALHRDGDIGDISRLTGRSALSSSPHDGNGRRGHISAVLALPEQPFIRSLTERQAVGSDGYSQLHLLLRPFLQHEEMREAFRQCGDHQIGVGLNSL